MQGHRIVAELGLEKSTKQNSWKAETPSQHKGQWAETPETHSMWYLHVSTYTDIASEVGITVFKDREINFVLNLHTTDIISKCSWVGNSYASIESRMLRKCGGIFGVAMHYHSSIICNKEGLPATNHL